MQKSLPSLFRSRPFAVAALATVLLFSLCAGTARAANWGYWDATRSYLAIDMGSGTPTTYCLYDNGAGDFQGADLGAIDQGDSFTIVNYYAKTWKNGGDVTGCDYTYQILDAGSAVKESGSINNGANPNCQDNGNGNQEWSSSAGNIAVGSTLEPGTYTLAVYGQITGGNDPAGPIDDGTATAPYTATFTVVAPVSYVARIVGGDSYATLTDAIAAADPGDTVELLDDIETDATVSVAKDLTIDLGGFTLSPAAGLEKTFTASAGTVVVTNGTIAGRVNCYDSSTLTVAANTTVDGYVVVWGDGTYGEAGCLTPAFNLYGTVEAGDGTAIFNGSGDESRPSINIFEGAAVNADWGVILNGGANAAMSGGTINAGSRGIEATGGGTVTLSGGAVNATGSGIGLWEGATLAMTGGDIVAGEFGVFNNGSQTNYTTTIAVSGGSITSTNTENTACGIYQAGPGTLTLSGTAVVSGPDAVEVRAGTVEVLDNARLVATMAYTAPTSNGNGNSGHGGAALLVSQHTTVQAIDATVSGGTLEGEVAFAEVTVEADNDGSLVTGSIDGGTIAGAVTTENIETLIPSTSAALFSNADAEGVEEGYALKETSEGSGVYQVVKTYVVTYANDDGTALQVTTNFVGEATPAYAGATPTKPADAQYTYTFKDWGTVAATVTADATYTATYSSTLNKYQLVITYVTPAGTVTPEGYAAEYAYGEEYNVESPDVDGCTPDTAAVTGAMGGEDVAVTVTYTLNRYTVTFKDEDGSVISSADYDYGTAAADIVKPADPTKEADAQYTYSFAGWSPTLAEVTEDATYTATYSSALNQYTVTFVWHGDSLVRDYDYGTPATDVAVPRNPPSYVEDNKIYAFSGWNPATVAAVTGDATYTATYTETAAVAKIGDTFYATLADAVAAVPAGGSGVISILADTTLSTKLEVADKTIGFAADQAVTVTGQLRVVDGASVTIGENVAFTSEGHPTVFVLGDPAVNTPGTSPSALVVDGAVYNTNPGFDATFAVSGNGSDTQGVAVTVNGIVSNANGIAIYQPEPGALVINGTVAGASAVSIKDGTLAVNDGAVVAATLADGLPYTGNNNGDSPTGDAIIAPYYDPSRGYGTPVVDISGGTITVVDAANCSGIEAYDFDGVEAPADAASNVAVSGGTFNTPVADAYCAEGFIPADNGDNTYGVEPGWTVTFVNEKGDAPAAQKIADGATAGEPEEPTAEGFAFAGWFAEGGSEAFDFDTAITADLTLTAAWDTKVAVPEAVAGLVYDSTEQTGVVADAGYTLAGNTAINAGGYTATATLEAGFIWADGTTGAKEIPWSIAPAPVTVTAVDASKVYGHVDPALSYTVDGLLGGDTITSGVLLRLPGETVGSYDIVSYNFSAGDNYTVAFISGSLEITKRPIGVAAEDCSKIVGAGDPAFAASIVSGTLADGQTVTWSFERDPGEDPGTYAILPIAAISDGTEDVTANYEIEETAGELTIEPDYIGATSADGLVVLSTDDPRCVEPLAFRSIAVDGTTVTADFSGTIANPNGVAATELRAVFLVSLPGTPEKRYATAVVSGIDAANGTAKMTAELPEGFDSATFFLAGFDDAE